MTRGFRLPSIRERNAMRFSGRWPRDIIVDAEPLGIARRIDRFSARAPLSELERTNMYTVEFFGPTFGVVDRAVAGMDRAMAIETANRMLAMHRDLKAIAGVRVIDQNGIAVFTKYVT